MGDHGDDERRTRGALASSHERIRRHVGMARALADGDVLGSEEVRRVARAVHRCFAEELPRHGMDEDLRVAPRLREVANESVIRALDAMSDEHRDIASLVWDLLSIWADVAEEPDRLEGARGTLCDLTPILAGLLTHHLSSEEAMVFPAPCVGTCRRRSAPTSCARCGCGARRIGFTRPRRSRTVEPRTDPRRPIGLNRGVAPREVSRRTRRRRGRHGLPRGVRGVAFRGVQAPGHSVGEQLGPFW
ncbi:MAG: hemerythrin domain-containing protein [Myxococcota bacterium]